MEMKRTEEDEGWTATSTSVAVAELQRITSLYNQMHRFILLEYTTISFLFTSSFFT